MRKMTQKEFIEAIYEVTDRNRKISDYEDLLNAFAVLLHESSDNAQKEADESEDEKRRKIYTDFANTQRKRAVKVFNILKERGYYNE